MPHPTKLLLLECSFYLDVLSRLAILRIDWLGSEWTNEQPYLKIDVDLIRYAWEYLILERPFCGSMLN